ncbi:transcriptional regulator [Herbidospora galbida]|uniref:Transcriptional regulator n=1 Tax=Herbidospora galbida TaxID=2575442 RepID=A0A4U3M4R7_9ACTN|nr:helix-turn-helix transcriptional regulator [Herbidospora galbida]TKK83825.1 transcriptional regulator [Herbidospora galbida]
MVRHELAAFLKNRRSRISPSDVGLPPGTRRRTPGLRREEVAQLAGVGVTWYTWLEQGRPINVSGQVLDAVARTLKLDADEREHLYRLADVPGGLAGGPADDELDQAVRDILAGLDPLPAAVYNARYDVLAWNQAYAAIFCRMVTVPRCERNALWQMLIGPSCCAVMMNREEELPQMVATFRAAYARHLGEPAWTTFIDRLTVESAEFARMWATHDVTRSWRRTKILKHPAVGLLNLASTSLTLGSPAESRVVVYTPADEASRANVQWLYEHKPGLDHDH